MPSMTATAEADAPPVDGGSGVGVPWDSFRVRVMGCQCRGPFLDGHCVGAPPNADDWQRRRKCSLASAGGSPRESHT
jgi:hypothetical protein